MKIQAGRLLDFVTKEVDSDDNSTGKEKIIEHAVWLLIMDAIDKMIPQEKKRKYVLDILSAEIDKWLGKQGEIRHD